MSFGGVLRYNYRLFKRGNILKIFFFFFFFFARRDFIIFAFNDSRRELNFNLNLNFKFNLFLFFDINFRRNKEILLNASFINFEILFLRSKISFLILKNLLRVLIIIFFVEIIIIFNKFNYYFFDFFFIDNDKNSKILNFSRFFDYFKRVDKSVENNFRSRLK